MPILTFPLALIGLAAPLGLVGIYLLRNRFRRQTVSSLLLWADYRSPREGGSKMQRWRAPWLFLLELLAMLLLVAAAIGPRWLSATRNAPLLVVLDDSYSMQATDSAGRSALAKAKAAVRDQIANNASVGRLILASNRPRVLGSANMPSSTALNLLDQWRATGGTADLQRAVALATELGGPRGRIMVVTDHAPPEQISPRVQWRAFGSPEGNLAIVSAARDGSRVMLEITNFSANSASTQITLTKALKQAEPVSNRVSLDAGESKRWTFDVGEDAGTVTASLNNDALGADNFLVLPDADRAPLNVQVNVKQQAMREAVERALRATGGVRFVTAGGQLVITDDAAAALPGIWQVQLLHGQNVRGYVGPFVVDRSSVLTEGLSLAGVVWVAGDDAQLPANGRPIVMAGDRTLVSEQITRDGAHIVRMALNGEATNLTRLVDWPMWWWNIARWRTDALPGVRPRMVRLGQQAVVIVPSGVHEVTVTEPGGAKPASATVHDGRVVIEADKLGRWKIDAGERHWELAVNALSGDESDVRSASAGSWGRWVDEPGLRREYVNYAWAAALGAMALLLVHLWLVGESTVPQATEGRR